MDRWEDSCEAGGHRPPDKLFPEDNISSGNMISGGYILRSHVSRRTLSSGSPTRLVFSVIFPQASKNIYGGVQGGMISAALDEATFISILRSQKDIEKVSSTNHHVLFHKPVRLGKNTIETKFKKIGKRVINIEGNIYGVDQELAATLIHSTSIIRSSEGSDEF